MYETHTTLIIDGQELFRINSETGELLGSFSLGSIADVVRPSFVWRVRGVVRSVLRVPVVVVFFAYVVWVVVRLF